MHRRACVCWCVCRCAHMSTRDFASASSCASGQVSSVLQWLLPVGRGSVRVGTVSPADSTASALSPPRVFTVAAPHAANAACIPQTQTLCQGPMKLKVVFSPGFGGICSTDASFLQPFHEDAPARSGLHTSGPCSSHSVCLEPLCSEVELPLGVSESHVTQRARGPGWCC